MDRRPVETARRHRYESLIRVIDLIAYATVLIIGVYAMFFTPPSVYGELAGVKWLVWLWSGLLLAGGIVGFVGRSARYWFLEVPSTVLAFTGLLIYFVVLGRFAFSSVGAAVAAGCALVSVLLMARRWAELQIFATDPDATDFKTRMADALRRRTSDFVHRHQ